MNDFSFQMAENMLTIFVRGMEGRFVGQRGFWAGIELI